MKKLPFILLSILVFSAYLLAQPVCPTITITAPSGLITRDYPITFTALVEPTQQALTYRWTISSGKIIEGQGTDAIEVLIDKYGSNTTATVEIDGLQKGCTNIASENAQHTWCPTPELIDILPAPIIVKYRHRFETIVQKLGDDPTSRLVIVLYFDSARRQAVARRAILSYLRLPVGGRITFLEDTARGGDEFAKFWVVPSGALDPTP